MTFTIKKEIKNIFEEKLSEVNKKLAKYNRFLLSIVSKEEILSEDGIISLVYEISGLEIISNGKSCTHVGTISFKDGIKTIFSTIENSNFNSEKLRCDHCKIDRKRSKYFVFNVEGEGEGQLMIGSSCAQDYFGVEVEKALSIYENFQNFGSELEKVKESNLTSLRTVMAATWKITGGFKAWVKERTASDVQGFLNLKLSEKEENLKLFSDTIREFSSSKLEKTIEEKLISKYQNIEITNDFISNIVNNLFGGDTKEIRWEIKSVGVVAYAIFAAMQGNIGDKVEGSEKVTSTFQGNVGDKIEVIAIYKDCFFINTSFGVTGIITFSDSKGNIYKTFTTSASADKSLIGKQVTIKGTVKDHKEYKGVKETILTRIKIS